MSSTPICVVDAFTDQPFRGNPAAVSVLPGPREDAWMQAVAREMNLSETAFLFAEGDGWRLRWFTPAVEVDLCGHATLASAHVLWQEGRAAPTEPIRFHTRSGLLAAARRDDSIELDFPAKPARPAPAPAGLLEALGATARYVGLTDFDYLIEAESAAIVRGLQPDFPRLRAAGARGIIVTARSDDPAFDFVSRFFAPCAGIDEDPVTGSAHCSLGPYWAERLGRTTLAGYQASARGGTVRVEVGPTRVKLGGQAVTVWRGWLDAAVG
jgi:PhzF family phenazine biosynthesis protein